MSLSGCEESMYVSQMCEVKLPDEILPMPFAIQTRRFPRVMGECKRSSREDYKKQADIRGILFEEEDVGSDNHCNVLGARISEHSMSKTTKPSNRRKPSAKEREAALRRGPRCWPRWLTFQTRAIRGRRSAAAQAAIGCKSEKNWPLRRHARRNQQRCLRAPIMGVGRDHGARF